eukprot:TRINITY_DN253_c0_g1_i7.p1 TRINITY_DN253_c0_g1~~TRINITY_DN253_c0_g1_i7.p1  ORF type:complete len:452 (+),score=71.95 TRINITY_DN253_c0_g1_i7:146-1501(+)
MSDSLHGLEAQLAAMGFGHAAVAEARANTPNPDLNSVLAALVSQGQGSGATTTTVHDSDNSTTTMKKEDDGGSDGNSGSGSDNGDDLDYDSCDEDDIVFYEDDDAEDYAPTQEDIRRHSHNAEEFQVWTESSVIEKQKETADRISQVLAIPLHRAVVLLISYRWSEDQLLSAWWANPDEVAQRVGVETEEQRRHPARLEADQMYTCGICMDDEITGQDMALMPCGHLFCKGCWQGNLGVCIKEGESILIECMAPKCNMKVPETTVRSIVDDEMWDKYKYFEAKEFVSSNPYVRWCPAPGCSKAIRITEDSSNVVSCQCGLEFCFGCSEQPHPPATCDQVRRWKKKCSDDSETAHWIQANTKGCPGCLASIEKNGGCNHVTCSKCRHEFCWVCNGSWAEHKGNYSCNRYNEAEKSNQNASQRALSRYLHYYTRCMLSLPLLSSSTSSLSLSL